MEKKLVVHIEKCVGCHTCEFVCAITHSTSKDPETIIQTGEKPGHRVFVETYGGRAVPVHCNHCKKAACMIACPTHAIYREDENGPVEFDVSRCIGCRMCVQACPFGVITMSADGRRVIKCDLCIERLAEGQEPACVVACPTKAVVFETEEEDNRSKRRRSAELIVTAQEEGQV
ncbi:4Fe-4S dicluster domain-containing protein [candidate division KSB3 bacterium]|uniref:4Fe-4S dicluster domain-containing protein n=1 Tax=candidate division KSB3 bacterium TaxID=2044937 RepID=A0A9D5JVN2_9BACT|nr:4Fe-4S dicluster domain-containing protein [candidate division KSB3 bacterium]MBD3324757.1 4Fe-4S dicluster domain-containing protein [candidate division KSB3 bacterium]